MLAFPLFWVFTSADYYSSIKDKQPRFYVSASCFSYHFNSLIQMSKRWKKKPTLNVSFPLVRHYFSIKEFTRDIVDIYVSTFVIYQMFWFLKNRRKILPNIMCQILHYYGSLITQTIINKQRINIRHDMLAHPIFSQHLNLIIQTSKRRE